MSCVLFYVIEKSKGGELTLVSGFADLVCGSGVFECQLSEIVTRLCV